MKPMLPTPTLFDRLVGAVSPQAMLDRLQARYKMQALTGDSAYYAGSTTRRAMLNMRPAARSVDADMLPALDRQRAVSRELVRNHPLATGAVASTTANVVGTGLSVQPAVQASALRLTNEQAAEINAQLKCEFELWAGRAEWCDIRGKQNFYQLSDLAFRSSLESGDVFTVLPMDAEAGGPYATRVQLIEADRCCNPSSTGAVAAGTYDEPDTWYAGIRCNAAGRALQYAFAARHPGNGGAKNSWAIIDAMGARGRRNVLHLMTHQRPGQRRGIPFLAPVVEPLLQLSRYSEAELMAAVISSAFTVFVEHEAAGDSNPILDDADNGAAPQLEMQSGAIIDLARGEKVSFADPSRPNAAFDPFFMAMLRQIGPAIEIPVEVLIMHYTSSYTAARAALLDAWRLYRRRREWLAADWCQPIYETVITEAVANGRVRLPGFFRDDVTRAHWLRALWTGDAPGSVDPVKDATAAEINLRINRTTLARETVAYSGTNVEDVIAQRGREQQLIEKAGLAPKPAPAPAAQSNGGAAPPDPAVDPAAEPDDDDTETDQKPA